VLARLAAVVLVLALVVGCSAGDDVLDVHDVEEAEAPPRDAVLVEAEWPETAAWIRREAAADRPVLMNILASWCIPCERELPLLLDAAEDNPEIAFLGIDHQDQRESAEAFVEEQGITFPTLFDIGGDVAYSIEGRGMPTTAVFDRDGRMVAKHTGELTAASLEDLLDQVR
jgi:cytochrome c biogenesis protein CcmG, thiol:disulfide interchange protein DsbE